MPRVASMPKPAAILHTCSCQVVTDGTKPVQACGHLLRRCWQPSLRSPGPQPGQFCALMVHYAAASW